MCYFGVRLLSMDDFSSSIALNLLILGLSLLWVVTDNSRMEAMIAVLLAVVNLLGNFKKFSYAQIFA
jgi:hypothetical protein